MRLQLIHRLAKRRHLDEHQAEFVIKHRVRLVLQRHSLKGRLGQRLFEKSNHIHRLQAIILRRPGQAGAAQPSKNGLPLPSFNDGISAMKAKHAKTLQAIFALPTRASIAFSEIEALLIALGVEKTERQGSRVKFALSGVEWHAHRPHPGKEAKKYQVEQARDFLTTLEIKP